MSDRIHLQIEPADKERYRLVAEREGKSLSLWLREAAEEKWSAAHTEGRLETRADLETFFTRCDQREVGREPDWDAHRKVMQESITGRGNAP